jgi:hypothetical protein
MTKLTAITFAVSSILFSVRPTDALAFTSHASTLRKSFLAGNLRVGKNGRFPVLFSHGEESERAMDIRDETETADIVQGDNDASNDSPQKVQNVECSEEEVKVGIQEPSFRDRLEALGIEPVTVSNLRRKAVAPPSLPKSPSLSNPGEDEEKEDVSAIDPTSSCASTNESECDNDILSSHYDPASEMEKRKQNPTPLTTSTIPTTVAPWPALPPTTIHR